MGWGRSLLMLLGILYNNTMHSSESVLLRLRPENTGCCTWKRTLRAVRTPSVIHVESSMYFVKSSASTSALISLRLAACFLSVTNCRFIRWS